MDFDLIIFTAATALDSTNPMNQVRIPLYEALARQLLSKGQVLVVTHYLSVVPDAAIAPRRLCDRIIAPRLRRVAENLHVCSPLIPIKLGLVAKSYVLLRAARAHLGRQVQAMCREAGLANAHCVVSVNDPFHGVLLGLLRESLRVYDCLDEYALYGGVQTPNQLTLRLERELAQRVDVVLTTSQPLFEKMRPLNGQTYYSPNAADFEFFHQATLQSTPVARRLDGIPRPIVGFMGNLTHWYDFPLLRSVIQRKPEWSFVFIGWVTPYPSCLSDIQAIQTLPNTYFLGCQQYEALPSFLKGFDVAIMPYGLSGAGPTVNPDKMYQYLAAGLPVVATPTPEIAQFSEVIEVAVDVEGFVQAIARCLSENGRDLIKRRTDIAQRETWEHRAERQLEVMERCLRRKIGANAA
jgi:glycosyltransferase involved in cell wall biosynthesis